jgi:hypothetical protein
MPGCMFTKETAEHQEGQVVDDVPPNFAKFSTNWKLNIKWFITFIDSKIELYTVFNNGMAKEVRLDPTYSNNIVDGSKHGSWVLCLSEKRQTGQYLRAKHVMCTYAKLSRKVCVSPVLKNGIQDSIYGDTPYNCKDVVFSIFIKVVFP